MAEQVEWQRYPTRQKAERFAARVKKEGGTAKVIDRGPTWLYRYQVEYTEKKRDA